MLKIIIISMALLVKFFFIFFTLLLQ